jgi:hypothetical protein
MVGFLRGSALHERGSRRNARALKASPTLPAIGLAPPIKSGTRPRRWLRLVQDLDDAIGVKVNNRATAIDDRRAVARPIRDRSRTDVARKRLTSARILRDRDARTVTDRAIVRGGESRLAGLGRRRRRPWRPVYTAQRLVLGKTHRCGRQHGETRKNECAHDVLHCATPDRRTKRHSADRKGRTELATYQADATKARSAAAPAAPNQRWESHTSRTAQRCSSRTTLRPSATAASTSCGRLTIRAKAPPAAVAMAE